MNQLKRSELQPGMVFYNREPHNKISTWFVLACIPGFHADDIQVSYLILDEYGSRGAVIGTYGGTRDELVWPVEQHLYVVKNRHSDDKK